MRRNKLRKFDIYENKVTINKCQRKSHPAIIMSDKKDYVENYIITHKKPKGNYYKFKKNPNFDDSRQTYISKRLFKTSKSKIGHRFYYRLGNDDKYVIEVIYRKTKNKKNK